MTSTIGESFILMLRASRAVSTLSRLWLLKAALLVVLAGKGLDQANGREHFFDRRNQFAFLFSDVARGFLDPPREEIDHQEQDGRDGERDQP